MHTTSSTRRSPSWYTNAALSAIALLLGLHLLQASNVPLDRMASAQDETPRPDKVTIVGNRPVADESNGLISAAEQRKQIISELKTINSRLERVESALARGINVNVKSMPAQPKDAPKTEGK